MRYRTITKPKFPLAFHRGNGYNSLTVQAESSVVAECFSHSSQGCVVLVTLRGLPLIMFLTASAAEFEYSSASGKGFLRPAASAVPLFYPIFRRIARGFSRFGQIFSILHLIIL